ncbi:MAG: sulfotransferase family protein [Henriciella sp.]
MGLKVIGAGFGRTGTLSMKAALEQLGYLKTHHMVEVLSAGSGAQLDYWDQIGQGEAPDWHAVFDGYQACVDFPACGYWRELAEAFPEAKVILNVRDFDAWYASADATIFQVASGFPVWMRRIPRIKKIRRMLDAVIWQAVFKGRFGDKAFTKQIWEQHLGNVQAELPPDRLLVFDVRDGWEPLCAFLDVPVPEGAFPRLNDTQQFGKLLKRLRMLRYLPWVAAIGLAGMAVSAYLAFS